MKTNKITAKREFNSFLEVNNLDRWNMLCDKGYFTLTIRGEEAGMKKFKENFVGPKKRKIADFTKLLLSISDGFKAVDCIFNSDDAKTIYLYGDWKFSYHCDFDEIPVPVNKWLKTLSEKLPDIRLSLSRSFYSSIYLGFEKGNMVKEK